MNIFSYGRRALAAAGMCFLLQAAVYAAGSQEDSARQALDAKRELPSFVLVPKMVSQGGTMKITWKYFPEDKAVWLGKLRLYKGGRFLEGVLPEDQKHLSSGTVAWPIAYGAVPGADFKLKASFYKGTLKAPDPVAEVWSTAFVINKYEQIPKGDKRCVDSDNSPDYSKKIVVFPVAVKSNPELFKKGTASGAVYAGSSDPSRHVILGQFPDPAVAKDTKGEVSIIYDYCQGENIVEGYCTADGILSAMGVKCPNGCAQGACRQ